MSTRSPSTTQNLPPVPRRWVRLCWLVPLWALGVISSAGWPQKLLFFVVSALFFGTYRRFRLKTKSLQHLWTVAFFDLPRQQWKLRRFTKIEVQYEHATGILELLLFGPIGFVWGWIVDRFFSWVGGTYQIWLNDESDDRVLAWQGNNQGLFEQNLERIKGTTGLPVVAR